MYNFMEKNYQDEVKKYEIEKAFHQEQIDEDKKRHKKLIEGLMSKEEKLEEPKKGESWIEKMLSGMKSALGILLAPLGVLSFLTRKLFSYVGGLADIFKGKNILKLIGDTTLGIIRKIFKVAFLDLIWPLMKPVIWPLIAAYVTKLTLENTDSIFKYLEGIGGGTHFLSQAEKVREILAEISTGKVSEDALSKFTPEVKEGYKSGKYQIYDIPVLGSSGRRTPMAFTDEERKSLFDYYTKFGKAYEELSRPNYVHTNEEKKKLYDIINENALAIANIEKQALNRIDPEQRKKDSFWHMNYPKAESELNAILNKGGFSNVEGDNKSLLEKAWNDFSKQISGEDDVDIPLEPGDKLISVTKAEEPFFNIPKLPSMEELMDEYNKTLSKGKNAATTVINKVNNIGNLKDEIKQLQPSRARDDDSTILKVITNSTIPV